MGAGASKLKDPLEDSSTRSFAPGMPRDRVWSFHEALVRERDPKHDFYDVYEVLEVIGRGGNCTIYKIKKKDQMVGGSAREENVRSSRNLIRRVSLSPRYTSKTFNSLIKRVSLSPKLHSSKSLKMIYSGEALSSSEGLDAHQLHQLYALKVFDLALVPVKQIDQLKNEIDILKTLDHKNIINPYETFTVKLTKKLMIVMELCTGGDLLARLPYTEQQAASVAKQILNAISYLHSKSIIHRDIKMENVIFESKDPDACIKVIDFGLSKKYKYKGDIMTERVGTLYSMSPQTMQGIYNSQADLWSIGVCTYMLLSNGQRPFEADTPKQLVARVLLGDFNFDGTVWSYISQKAKGFVTELLSVNPQNRPSADQALFHPWVTDVSSLEGYSTAPEEEFIQRVRESILRYADQGEFRKLALNVVAKKSRSTEISELRKVFDRFDTKSTGTITLEEFQDVFARFDYSEDAIKAIFRKIDINCNDVINYTEFLAAALETQGTIEEYRLAEAFDVMDTDDNGYISRKNLKYLLGEQVEDRYIDSLIAEGDFKRDGRISFEEFLQVFAIPGEEEMKGCDSADVALSKKGFVSTVRKGWSSATNLVGLGNRSTSR